VKTATTPTDEEPKLFAGRFVVLRPVAGWMNGAALDVTAVEAKKAETVVVVPTDIARPPIPPETIVEQKA